MAAQWQRTSEPFGQRSVDPPSPGGGDAREARRLFLGNLPKVKTEQDIHDELSRTTDGLVRVITYKNLDDPRLHRGFCFLDYESVDAAVAAMSRLSRCLVFGCRTVVDWADPEPDADAEVMARVRILFVRQYGGQMMDEARLAAVFGRHGAVDRVKALKNYAFVHFACRDDAGAAMDALNGAVDEASGVQLDVSWAKPPADKTDRERLLRDRERRMKNARPACAHQPLLYGPAMKASAGCLCAAGPAATVPYRNYDHYVYDFGRPWSGGANGCVAVAVRPPGRCSLCATDASVTGTMMVEDRPRTAELRRRERGQRNVDGRHRHQEQPQHDHGDGSAYAAATDMDAKILKFFYEMTEGAADATGPRQTDPSDPSPSADLPAPQL